MQLPVNVFTVSLIVILLVIQGTIIFRSALKNRIPYPYLWGFIGLLNIPSSMIFYLLFKRWYLKRKEN